MFVNVSLLFAMQALEKLFGSPANAPDFVLYPMKDIREGKRYISTPETGDWWINAQVSCFFSCICVVNSDLFLFIVVNYNLLHAEVTPRN